MGFEVEQLNETKVRIKVDIPAEEVASALDRSYGELKKVAKIDGFRKGKTPRNILEKYYAKSVEAEVLEDIVPKAYINAVGEAGLRTVSSPAIENEAIKIRKGEPLKFSATVEVRPDIELGEYKGIEIKDEKVEVTDDEVEDAIKRILDSNATLENVEEDRPVAEGDFVVMDFEGFLDGEPFDGGKANGYTLEIGSQTLIPGFEEQVVGADKGKETEVSVKFPDEYRNEKLAGQDAVFKVTVHEIKKKVLPELDDELAKSLNIGETAEEFREKVREELGRAKGEELASRQKHELIKKLNDAHDIKLPLSMVDNEYRNLLIRRQQEIMNSGMTPQQAGFDINEFEKDVKPIANERVKSTLILSEIASKEEINVSDEEVEAFLTTLSYQTGKSPDELREIYGKREGGMDELKDAISEEKVLDFLMENARKV